MSILLRRDTRILVQGITTTEGRQHTSLMLEHKAEIVAGVSPGKYGQEVMGVPVYDKVSEAVKRHQVDLSVIFVPKNAVMQAAAEAIESGIPNILIVTGLSLGMAIFKTGAAEWIAWTLFGSIGRLHPVAIVFIITHGVSLMKVMFSSNTVTGIMTEFVVNALEVIKVDIGNKHSVTVALPIS